MPSTNLQTVISRAALGRVAQIGALYDVRTERFLRDSLFSSKIEDKDIESTELGETSIELVMTDSLQEKFTTLDIEAELQVSLLAGLVKPSGSGAYLSENKKSARAQSMSVIYKHKTVNEEFILRHHKEKIDVDLLKSAGDVAGNSAATHVVVGIDWGAGCSITCECENCDDKDSTTVRGELRAKLDKLKAGIDPNGSTKAVYQNKVQKKTSTFTIQCKTDVSAKDKDLPTTFEGALELVKSLPSLVKNTNDGKGVPLLYTMKPLDTVVTLLRLKEKIDFAVTSIKEDLIQEAVKLVENISNQKQRLYDIKTHMNKDLEYIDENVLASIEANARDMTAAEASFKSSLQELTQAIRRREKDSPTFQKFITKAEDNFVSIKNEDCFKEYQNEMKKIKIIQIWKERGIVYLGKGDVLMTDDADTVYVYYKPKDEMGKHHVVQDYFLRLQKSSVSSDIVFKVIDQSVRPDLWADRGEKPTIDQYIKGFIACNDLYPKDGQDYTVCLIQHDKPLTNATRPPERAFVKIPCPNSARGSKQCSGSPLTWKCAKCKEFVEYGIKTLHFYCKCGKSKPSHSGFRCNEEHHGIHFVKYAERILGSELSKLRAEQEKNILILGETGVGKSTWINGLYNYLSFSCLHEAKEAKDSLALISSQFTFTDDNGEAVDITFGKESDNDIHEPGHSVTQRTRAYTFLQDETMIRFIDTPGIGDSRGIEKDRENFDNILSYLSYYEEIHAICILLKPNNSRLNVMFQFCIQELLMRLQTSALNNIVFCFTNARATFYKPGDTLPILNKLLREKKVGIEATKHNYFCFDNEPFRFLACLREKIQFNEEDIRTYADSWDRAVSETKRLFIYVDKLPPHKVRNTISMNEARRVILAMSKPMATVARTIQTNVHRANHANVLLHSKDMTDLKQNLKFSGIDLERKELPYPMTVCTHDQCIKRVYTSRKTGTKTIMYDQVCHAHCSLEGIPTETSNDFRLQKCRCFQNGNLGGCVECGHHYTQHMHITYRLEEFEKLFISKKVHAQILAKKTRKEKIEEFKNSVVEKVKELRFEESIILQASAKYGSYLKKNALIPYNDAVGDYLDMCIVLEEKAPSHMRNADEILKMRQLRTQYEKEKQILEEAIQKETTPEITTEQVLNIQRELFRLKHFGETLESIFKGISITRSADGMCFQETIAHTHDRLADKGNMSTVSWPRRQLKRLQASLPQFDLFKSAKKS